MFAIVRTACGEYLVLPKTRHMPKCGKQFTCNRHGKKMKAVVVTYSDKLNNINIIVDNLNKQIPHIDMEIVKVESGKTDAFSMKEKNLTAHNNVELCSKMVVSKNTSTRQHDIFSDNSNANLNDFVFNSGLDVNVMNSDTMNAISNNIGSRDELVANDINEEFSTSSKCPESDAELAVSEINNNKSNACLNRLGSNSESAAEDFNNKLRGNTYDLGLNNGLDVNVIISDTFNVTSSDPGLGDELVAADMNDKSNATSNDLESNGILVANDIDGESSTSSEDPGFDAGVTVTDINNNTSNERLNHPGSKSELAANDLIDKAKVNTHDLESYNGLTVNDINKYMGAVPKIDVIHDIYQHKNLNESNSIVIMTEHDELQMNPELTVDVTVAHQTNNFDNQFGTCLSFNLEEALVEKYLDSASTLANIIQSESDNQNDLFRNNCDGDDDGSSSGSDISELDALDGYDDVLRDDSAVLDVVDNIDLSFDFNKIHEDGEKRASMPSQMDSSGQAEMSCISLGNDMDESYVPAPEISDSENKSGTENHEESVDTSLNVSHAEFLSGAPNDDEMYCVPSGERKRKRHFCFFCHTFQSVISRHLLTHKDEKIIKEALDYKPKSAGRTAILTEMRLKGDYIYNTTPEFNDGEKLVTRQPQAKMGRTAKDYVVCHKCFGCYLSIHRHRAKCLGTSSLRHRSNPILSNLMAGQIHDKASIKLIKLFSVLNRDDVRRAIAYDRILIIFGNDLCARYVKQRQHNMIRARLRQLGRLLIEMKSNNSVVTDFASLINAKYYDDIIKSIKTITGVDEVTNTFRAPATAIAYGTYLTKVAKTLRRESIQAEEYHRLDTIKYFLQVHEDSYSLRINCLAYETQNAQKRHKKVELPTIDDIKCFRNFLENKYFVALDQLKLEYSYKSWLEVSKTTLILVLLFNRKRPGELESMTIKDYENRAMFSDTHKLLYKQLSEDQKKLVDNYVRFELSGKLDRNVPVILSTEMQESVKAILEHRDKAGVDKKNPFVFALPGTDYSGRDNHLEACRLMREYATECGAHKPETLRATLLRKHIATTVASMHIAESQIYDISTFMGHEEHIHRHNYRQPVMSRDLCEVLKILEVAAGIDTNGKNIIRDSDINTDTNTDNPAIETETGSILNPVGLDHDEAVINSNILNSSSEDESHRGTESDSDWIDSDDSRFMTKRTIPRKPRTQTIKSKKQSTITKTGTKEPKYRKLRWTEREIELLMNKFGNHIARMELPHTSDIREFLKNNPQVKRTEAQVRTYIHNQYAAQKKNMRR